MNERPILFSAPMVRAILEDRKTMTRRVMKPQPPQPAAEGVGVSWIATPEGYFLPCGTLVNFSCEMRGGIRCPHGEAGDRLWVRETFLYRLQKTAVVYHADIQEPEASGIGAMYGGWKPSIFMPRWASRITLEITDVRVERVQDIGKNGRKAKQVMAEGITEPQIEHWRKWLHPDDAPAHAFSVLWDSLNAKRGHGWASNPWVWVISFKRIKP